MSFNIIAHHSHPLPAPSYESSVACGLFGISEDFSEHSLSLDEKYLTHRESTFFVRAGGDSMTPEIKPGDILIVDRSIPLHSGHIATFFLNGHSICKQYLKVHENIFLHSYNPDYDDFQIQENDDLQLFGVVVGMVRDLV